MWLGCGDVTFDLYTYIDEASSHQIKDFAMEAGLNVSCIVVNDDTVECDGLTLTREEGLLKASNALFWVYLCVYIFLVLFAGKFQMV